MTQITQFNGQDVSNNILAIMVMIKMHEPLVKLAVSDVPKVVDIEDAEKKDLLMSIFTDIHNNLLSYSDYENLNPSQRFQIGIEYIQASIEHLEANKNNYAFQRDLNEMVMQSMMNND